MGKSEICRISKELKYIINEHKQKKNISTFTRATKDYAENSFTPDTDINKVFQKLGKHKLFRGKK